MNGATLKQVEKLEYLGVAFTSDRKQDEELNTRIGKATKIRFFRRIEGVTLFNKVRSSEVRKSLNVESLLVRIERS